MSQKNTPTGATTRSCSNQQNNPTLAGISRLIENCKTEILASLNSKLDDIANKMTNMTNRMDAIDQKITQVELRCSKMEETSESFFSSITQEVEDRNRRRCNLIVSGIPEEERGSVEERREADETKVGTLMGDLNDGWSDDDIAHVHRIGSNVSKGPRLIRVICQKDTVRNDVLRKAKQLRNLPKYNHVYINPDLTVCQRAENKKLRDELRLRRGRGEDVVIRNGKVIDKNGNGNFH